MQTNDYSSGCRWVKGGIDENIRRKSNHLVYSVDVEAGGLSVNQALLWQADWRQDRIKWGEEVKTWKNMFLWSSNFSFLLILSNKLLLNVKWLNCRDNYNSQPNLKQNTLFDFHSDTLSLVECINTFW